MLARVIEARALARTAVAGLALGLFTLAGLALWGTTSTERATDNIRSINQVSDAWGHLSRHLDLAEEALREFPGAGTEEGRRPLISAVSATDRSLTWLERHGGPAERKQITVVRDTFNGYETTVLELYKLRGDQDQVKLHMKVVLLGSASLRKQVTVNIERKRLESTAYLDRVDQSNRRVRVAASVVFVAELVLLSLFAAMLLGYQRRLERQAARSRHQALHDSLTGLANRVLLVDRAEHALRTANRYAGETVGLLLIDLDRFKQVNDTLGHHSGDLLLRQVGCRLRAAVREVDTVARLGGDEFAVLMPRVGSMRDAAEVAERLLAELQQPVDLDGIMVDVNASLGVAMYPVHSGDTTQLLQHADIAMYTAKRAQLGTAVYDPHLNGHSLMQLTLLGELHRAIESGELVLHYQPKARTDGGQVCGVEALVRWQHPEHGLLAPSKFIPLAEQSGLIEPLTQHVLATALEQRRAWREEGLYLPVAINVAARCLLNRTFPTLVEDLLAKQGVAASQLTLELTESAIITDPKSALEVLHELRELGVRLSLDDFGTGYSSMAYLRTLPVHELKIDRSFVGTMQSEPSNRAIVRAVLELARNLGLQVVAEGVEDEETWAALAALGCHTGQGHYLSKPLMATGLVSWLGEQSETVSGHVA